MQRTARVSSWYVMALAACASNLHGLSTGDIFKHKSRNLLPQQSNNNLVSLSSVTACVHPYVAHNLTYGPPQLFAMLPWQSHKGDEEINGEGEGYLEILQYLKDGTYMKSADKNDQLTIRRLSTNYIRRKYTFSPYILNFFHFGPYILILLLLVPKSINACYFGSFHQSTAGNI